MHAQYTLEEKGAYKRGKIPVIVKEGRGLFSGGYGTRYVEKLGVAWG